MPLLSSVSKGWRAHLSFKMRGPCLCGCYQLSCFSKYLMFLFVRLPVVEYSLESDVAWQLAYVRFRGCQQPLSSRSIGLLHLPILDNGCGNTAEGEWGNLFPSALLYHTAGLYIDLNERRGNVIGSAMAEGRLQQCQRCSNTPAPWPKLRLVIATTDDLERPLQCLRHTCFWYLPVHVLFAKGHLLCVPARHKPAIA